MIPTPRATSVPLPSQHDLRLSASGLALVTLTLLALLSSSVAAEPRLLSDPNGLGSLTEDGSPLPIEVKARDFLKRLTWTDVQPADGSLLVRTRDHWLDGERRRLSYDEKVDGVPVFRGRHSVFLSPDGDVTAVLKGSPADPGRPGPFVLGPEQAALLAHALIEGETEQLPARIFEAGFVPHSLQASAGRDDWFSVPLSGLEQGAHTRRVVWPDGPRAAWQVHLSEREEQAKTWFVFIDATSGEELDRIYMTREAVQARVYPEGILGPSALVDIVDKDTVLSEASPEGWMWADRTEGNNVYVWEDRLADGSTTEGLYAYVTGDPGSLDFPVVGDPAADLDAALTNVFWASNYAHDRLHELGFNETANNCQDENFGRGGRGGDRTRVGIQYRAYEDVSGAYNNSYVSTSFGDGQFNQILLGLWDRSGELRDGALDTGLLYHEYGHLMVVRMLGVDMACDDGPQAEALAEGWGDYIAASFTGDTRIGAYVSGNDINGLRTRPIDENTYSYFQLCNIGGARCQRNEDGEIWAGVLWDLRTALIAAHGQEKGAYRADQLVVQGLNYTSCPPSFLDARDGILAADLALRNGEDRCLIWGAMAGRGLGATAETWGSADTLPWPAFDTPDECRGEASVYWGESQYGDDADATVTLVDAAFPEGDQLLEVSSSSGDVESYDASGEGMARRATVAIKPGAPAPGDGILQVVDGDTLTATCTSCTNNASADVVIQRAVNFIYRTHRLRDQTCDDDTDTLFGEPALLDAGEYARVTVTLGNAETFAIEDAVLEVSCDHPAVHVVPNGTFPIGDVKARTGVGYPVVVDLYMYAEPTVTFGEIANVSFHLTGRGVEGTAVMSLPLAADYRAEPNRLAWGAVETFEPGSPSVADWTHQAAGGLPNDLWDLQDCGDDGGRSMSYAGPACTEYDDEQAAALLISPPVFDFSGPGVHRVEPTGITWRNNVDLGREPRSLYCDSEMVSLYLTDDPLGYINFAEPRNQRGSAVQYWAQWTGLNNERNTNGWEDATPQQTINDSDVRNMSLPDVRLVWAFFTDVYSVFNNGGCRLDDEDAVGLGYHVDDIAFTYDSLTTVTADPALTCTPTDCLTWAHLIVETDEELPCPGAPVYLSVEYSDTWGCPMDEVEYRISGPGLDTGWGAQSTAVGVASENANWTGRVRCLQNTACNRSISQRTYVLGESQGGRVLPESLRVERAGNDVFLSWDGTRSPDSYAVFGAAVPVGPGPERESVFNEMKQNPPAPAHRKGSAESGWFRDAGAGHNGVTLEVYRVTGRNPCTLEPSTN